MDRKVRHALKLLRASAAADGLSLAHLSDGELLEGVADISHGYLLTGQAPSLIAAGHKHIGYAFADLWIAAKLERNLPFTQALRGEASAE